MMALPPDFRDPDFLRRQALALLAFDEVADGSTPAAPAAASHRLLRLALASDAFARHPRAVTWRAQAQGLLGTVPTDPADALALQARAAAFVAGLGPRPDEGDDPSLPSGSLEPALARLQALVLLRSPRAADLASRLADLAPQGLLWDAWTANGQPRLTAEDGTTPGFRPGLALCLARMLLAVTPADAPVAAGDDHALGEHQARELFAASMLRGWDRAHDGLHACIGVDDGPTRLLKPVAHDAQNPAHDARFVVIDDRRPTTVQAEAIATAATLATRTLEGGYWDWYDRVWAFAWEHLREPGLDGRWRPAPASEPPADDDGTAATATATAMLQAILAGLRALSP
jgi:mannose/cellobiose epimerase-like protein (N-acyl-D-glucosamine 2-epimerase family)